MCNHPNREAAMVTVQDGIWCDPCIAPIVGALNAGAQTAGLPTITSQRFGVPLATLASCCGHSEGLGWIALADDRVLTLEVSDGE